MAAFALVCRAVSWSPCHTPFQPFHLCYPRPPLPSICCSDALAYDRATCGKTCKSSEFALATAEALAEAVDKCGCDAAATSLAIVSTVFWSLAL